MSHVRTQIRAAIVTALTGLTTTGSNVFPSRVHPFHNAGSELPGLCIYTDAEEVALEDEDAISHIQQRTVLIMVEGYASALAAATLENTLDTIASEVETAIFADQFLGGLVHGVDLVGSESDLEGDAERPVGVKRIIFKALYLTTEGAPQTAL